MIKDATISVVIPVYNEQDCLNELMSRLLKLAENLSPSKLAFIFVNDGSVDNSRQILAEFARKYDFVKVINFSRNFGHQMAISAGLDYSSTDFTVILDADLQDPPELIKDMFFMAQDGFDIVYGKRLKREGETFFKKATASCFYRFLNYFCEVEIPSDTGDFRLINKKVLNQLKKMREKHRFIRGMVPWVGFKSTPLYYNREKRFDGVTKFPLSKMIAFALDAVFSFSNKPLRFGTLVGCFIFILSIITAIIMLYAKLFTNLAVPGITVTILTVIMLGSFQIIMLGIIGEYIGKIFEEIKNRPLYIIDEILNDEE